MLLKSIYLQHFRNYTQSKFDFSDTMTIIVGQNTAGKTHLSEAIFLLSTGKSFKTHTDTDMISFGQDVGRVAGILKDSGISNFQFLPAGRQGPISNKETKGVAGVGDPHRVPAANAKPSDGGGDRQDPGEERTKVEVVIASTQATGGRFSKKFLINGVAKSRSSLAGLLPLVLFRPEELDIIIDGPFLRRQFLDEVLEQVDKEYLTARNTYERSLRQRNALLRVAQENGMRNKAQFAYWDELLIESGQILTQKREAFLAFVNENKHDIFLLHIVYDKSTISKERLLQYEDAEVGAGVTLVGPHRDDFVVMMSPSTALREEKNVRDFGSRGQQRLAVLQLKLLQIAFIKKNIQALPLLVLDDIFSELDSNHIQLVLEKVQGSQIILTTTHKEFIPEKFLKTAGIIELGKMQ